MATGHDSRLAPVPNWDLPTLAGAGGLRSSANDLLTFLEAFLGYRETPLAPAMNATREVSRPMGQGKFEIGLAWVMFGEVFWHSGGTGGFRSIALCSRKERTGLVVLSNASTLEGVDDIAFHLLNPNLPLANFEPPEVPEAHARIPLDNYLGRYEFPDRIFEITRDGNRLFAQSSSPQVPNGPKFELFAESEKTFLVRQTGSKFTFETGPDGRATGLMMKRAGCEPIHAARVP
jgi:hypothetical protein